MQDDQLYCETCGAEIQMVPDFEPEIENSISETLSTLAEEITQTPKREKEKEERDTLFSSRKFFIGCMFAMACAILLLVVFGFILFQNNSKGYQVSRAMDYADSGEYEKAVACLQAAERIDKEDANIYFLMADYYYMMGKESDAVATLRNIALSAEFLPEDIENAYSKLVSIYRKNEDYQSINDLLLACSDQNIVYMFQSYMAYPPEFSYIEGTYQEIIPLKLSSNTSGTIYYTTDGSEPTEESSVYTTPIFLETGTYTIKAFFVNEFGIKSTIASNTYVIDLTVPNAPEISVYSGEYTDPVMIEVTVPAGCKVYYTRDESEPTSDSTQYVSPIAMPIGSSVFKFVAYSAEGVSGEVVTRTYHLKLKAQYSVNDALERLSITLVEQGYILDRYGNKEGIQGRYVYKLGSVNRISDGQDYYFIYEYYEDLMENQSRTGRIFGVNIMTGECGNIGLDDQGGYYFDPFSQEAGDGQEPAEEEYGWE